VVGAAVGVRALVALALLGPMPLVSDAHDYFELAAALSAGRATAAFYWPPGESLVLAGAFAVLGKTALVARLVVVGESAATAVLTVLVARELAGERVARAAAPIAVLYVPSVLLCAQPYAQHQAALCLAAVAYFGLRAARERALLLYLLTGAALGLGCLTRPSMFSVAPVVGAGWWILARRSGRRTAAAGAALAAFACLVTLVPTLAHNAGAGAGWTLSTNNERNLFLGNNPYTPDYKTSHLGQRSLEELPAEARDYLASFYARPDAREAMQREAVSYMRSHPLRTALRTLNRTTSFWGFDYLASREIQTWRGASTRQTLPWLALEAGAYLAVAAAALAALVARGPACDRTWRMWLVAIALGYEAPYAIAFSGGTYHFPVMPLVLPFAAVTLADARATWTRVTESKIALAALSLLVVVEVQYAYYAVRWA
jgi:4-amino-4-deoxy-L-arabinose transferase-like glycosyltransferase